MLLSFLSTQSLSNIRVLLSALLSFTVWKIKEAQEENEAEEQTAPMNCVCDLGFVCVCV